MMEATKATTAQSAIRVFALSCANAKELAHILNRIIERRWRGIKNKPAQVVQIKPAPDANRLIVIASPADLQLIEALIAELDVLAEQDSISLRITPRIEPKSDTPPESTVTQIINLKYADCESTEEKLIILFQDEQFRIVSDKRTNTLIVVATESTIQKILSLVAELDVPSREDYQVIQLKLKYADCESVSEKVARLFPADRQLKIVPDKRTNTLLIVGSRSAIQRIITLVTKIDVSGSGTDREVLDTNKQEKVDSDLTPSPSFK
ncbi:MAG: secretin N-terminal domain-containing protein [Planctomycetota bacterium]|jgi:type II secretory pathway component GspD/PulD (secretin)